MENHFTEADILLLEKEICFKSYKDIAFLLDRPVDELIKFLDGWLPGKGLIPHQLLLNQKVLSRPIRVREKKEKKKEPVISSRIILPDQKQRRNRNGEIIYKTRKVDLSSLHSVKIDSKTWIYIKPGQDPVQAKDAYMKKLREHKSRFLEQEKTITEVKKFK
ncbi:MAG: hypothetical protein ACJ749_06775 [Flavisolibacter sp.]|jgi:hypothetical protein